MAYAPINESFELRFELSIPELNKILNALSHQPYIEVHELISKLQAQAMPQLQALKAAQQDQQSEPEDS
jgi:hypothetical protein